ncbi:YIP1 family protein [Candidatus Chloroploca sp. M-50]|uniref:YIP1 family protein n=1 Tax=Candidatus Chloroploca mongolica TaxID=2528176 RepID=A0ABS4DG68_9CHLR|nr:Yip1 family protein [Candidatus Chloroploca mongolica]MBP1468442.1 YIP1 family protein [Candidatus Chloroploca mongolica]
MNEPKRPTITDVHEPARRSGQTTTNYCYVNPWRTIWYQPRLALRSAVALRSTLETWTLSAFAGISLLFGWAAWGELGVELSNGELLALILLTGPFFGGVVLMLGGVLLRAGGWMLGGRASPWHVRRALVWSSLPMLVGLPLWIIALALPASASQITTTVYAMQAGLWGWAGLLSIVGLAEAHQISLARALLSWLLAIALLVGGFMALFGGSALLITLLNQG